jgi:hypothetical protein
MPAGKPYTAVETHSALSELIATPRPDVRALTLRIPWIGAVESRASIPLIAPAAGRVEAFEVQDQARVGLDISVGIGALTLVGIAVNNAIVLLDYANRRQAEDGLDISDALQSAASVRLRPILMTAATTMFALIPVAVNPSVGPRIFQPFAVTVIGGLLSSTIASLVLTPVLATFSQRRVKRLSIDDNQL